MADLIKRLRTPMGVNLSKGAPELCDYAAERAAAADRIEELEAEVVTARNDALEEAAKVGAGAATDWANDNSEKSARMGIWNTVHAAIRALKSTTQP